MNDIDELHRPITALPGTQQNVRVLEQRAAAHVDLFNPDDAAREGSDGRQLDDLRARLSSATHGTTIMHTRVDRGRRPAAVPTLARSNYRR